MTTVEAAVNDFLYSKFYLRVKTKDWYTQKLHIFSSWCANEGIHLEEVKARTVRQFLFELPPLSDSTQKGYAQVIKGFLTWCSREEEYEDRVNEKTASRIELPRVEQAIITTYTTKEILWLLAACEKDESPFLSARNKAIISVLIDTGVRASELCFDGDRPQENTGLRMANLELDPADSHILVYGKGKKQREIGLGVQAREALQTYLIHRKEIDKHKSPYVFLGRYGNPLSVRGLEAIISRLAEEAGVSGAYVHKFRHTFAVNYLLQAQDREGAALYKLMMLMGHTDISTTQIYLRSIQAKTARQGKSVLDNLK